MVWEGCGSFACTLYISPACITGTTSGALSVQNIVVREKEKTGVEVGWEGRESSGFTLKAFVVGAFLSFFLSIGAPYANMVIRGSYMALDFSTAGALFLFFVWVGIVNGVLRYAGKSMGRAAGWVVVVGAVFFIAVLLPYSQGRMALETDRSFFFLSVVSIFAVLAVSTLLARMAGRSLALNRRELIVVYIMMICASAIPTMGLSEYLLPIICAPFYYATPENDWANLIQPYIKDWMVPGDLDAIKHFYEGLPSGQQIPWGVWIRPLVAWGILLGALYLVMICMMVILRKQWVERERLIFPLVQLPQEMVQESARGSVVPPFFRNPVMWAGFVIPILIGTLNALHNYYNFIPGINLVGSTPVFRRTVNLIFRWSFPMIGFSYLINLDIAFSLWFFNLIALGQRGIFNILGIASTEKLGIYGAAGNPIQAHMGMGAITVLVLFGLWVARGHLGDVLRKAFLGDQDVDDSGELLSYRLAVLGLIGGLGVMTVWLRLSGFPLWAALVFLFGAFVIFVGLTRIVVEGGVAEGVASTISSSALVSGFGATSLSPTGITALAFTYVWSADIRTFLMASCANGLKLAQENLHRKRPLFWAIVLAVVVSLVGSIWMIMKMSYAYGGINLNGWFFGGGPLAPFNYITDKLNSPHGVVWGGWAYTGLGAGIMALLMIARQRLLWWPLHPLGFPIGAVWIMDQVWFSIFLAWLIKAVVLKYGGPKLYRATRPFFLGMILGQFVCAGAWNLIDLFTGMTDNGIFWI